MPVLALSETRSTLLSAPWHCRKLVPLALKKSFATELYYVPYIITVISEKTLSMIELKFDISSVNLLPQL